MIIIDENVDQNIVDQIFNADYEILSIRNTTPGISDREIISLAKSKKGFIITEDKDFGELVFSFNLKDCSVIFLRYNRSDYQIVSKNILKTLHKYYNVSGHFFITITARKIRVRKI